LLAALGAGCNLESAALRQLLYKLSLAVALPFHPASAATALGRQQQVDGGNSIQNPGK
jgi:hypothetical protein